MMRSTPINHGGLFSKFLAGAVLALCLHTAPAADKSDQNTAVTAPAAEESVTAEPTLQEKLLETTDAIKAREKELKLLEQKIKTSKDQNFLKQAEQEAADLKEIITDLKNQFVALAVLRAEAATL